MSKKSSKTLIGAFVIGAIALIVAGVVIFGSGKLFAPLKKFVMVFEGSVKGLNVGSPVIFRGVKIGEVNNIELRFNPKDMTAVIPVYVEIDPRKLTVSAEYKALMKETEKEYVFLKPLVEKGLKAQLQMQSFVTGQLMINLDFYPDKPIKLTGLDKRYPEIPTIPTGMEELTKTLENLKLGELFKKIENIADGIDKLVNSPEMKGSLASLNQTLKDADKLVVNLDGRIGPLVADLKSTSETARGALAQAEKTLAMKEGVPGELASSLKDTFESVRVTLAHTQEALNGVSQIADQNANIGYDISTALEEMTALSRSLRSLTNYLDEHPEALIRGKKPSKGE